MMDGCIIVLLGAPGAGKGTQAKRLAKKFSLTHLSTGDALRKAVSKGIGVGKHVGEIMEAGELVPDHLVAKIVHESMDALEGSRCFLLDGFPRNLSQAKFLEEMKVNASLLVINLRADEDVVTRRLSGRRYCADCGKIHNVHYSPPKKEAACDVCEGKLIQRKDDREEVIQDRLRVYREETEPLIDYYSKKDNFFEVDGNRDPQTVFEEISAKITSAQQSTGNSPLAPLAVDQSTS